MMSGKEEAGRQDTQLLEAFRLFDADNDSKINSQEVLNLIESLGGDRNSEHVQNLVKACEQSQNKSLDLDEFLKHWEVFKSSLQEQDSEEEILEAFRGYDLDCDGYITRAEMVAALERMGSIKDTEEEAQKCMQEMDLDGDGRVSYAEFLIKWRVS